MGRTDAGCTQALDLVVIGHYTMSDPCAVAAPTGSFEVFHRSTAERRQAEFVVLGILGKVRAQAHLEPLGQFGSAHHQRLGDTEW